MRHRKRLQVLALLIGVTLLVAACSDDKKTTTSSGGSASSSNDGGGAQSVKVQVDADTKDVPIGYTAFFPAAVTLHPGDTVEFDSNFNGEPHTVTFGSLLDEGVKKLDPNAQEEPAEIAKLPALLPDGPGDAIQAADAAIDLCVRKGSLVGARRARTVRERATAGYDAPS
jgi:plastocyanin